MKPKAVLLMIVFFVLQPVAAADDLTYVSDEELLLELERQQDDMVRAKARLASLGQNETVAVSALKAAQEKETRSQRIIENRIRLVYRLSNEGRIGQYLTGATSTIELFKRLQTLKYLVLDGLAEYGRAREQVARLNRDLAEIRDLRKKTDQMLTIFQQACAELIAEQQRRQTELPFSTRQRI